MSFLHAVKDDAIRTSVNEGPSGPEVHKVLHQQHLTMRPRVAPKKAVLSVVLKEFLMTSQEDVSNE